MSWKVVLCYNNITNNNFRQTEKRVCLSFLFYLDEVILVILSMEFEDLGKHCEYCRQKDILPFQCGNCKKYFCLQHIRIEEHKCEKKSINNNTIIICSKCGQAITLIPGVEPAILVEYEKQVYM